VRVLGDERLELAHDLGVPPERQLALDALLDAGDSELLQVRALGGGEPLAGQVRQRGPAPQRQRLLEPPGRAQPLEPVEVELIVPHREQVAGLLGLQTIAAENLAQLGDVQLQRLACSLGRVVLPQQVDEPIARDDAVWLQQQRCEQRPLLAPAQAQRAPVGADLERAQDAELHARPTLRSPPTSRWTSTRALAYARQP